MTKERRDLADYEPDVDRFEEWLEAHEQKTLIDIETADELVKHLSAWLTDALEVTDEKIRVALANSMVGWMIKSRQFGDDLRRPARVVAVQKKVSLFRTGERWGKREEGLLRYRYQRPDQFKVRGIAKDLGRSVRSIYVKAYKLRVKREQIEE